MRGRHELPRRRPREWAKKIKRVGTEIFKAVIAGLIANAISNSSSEYNRKAWAGNRSPK